MGKISVVINTWNEEKNIPRALTSVKDLADEVVVVDAQSADHTVQVAKKLGAKVYNYDKPFTHVEQVRNFALNKASHEWIVVLDADEELPEKLKRKIKKIIKKPVADYYRFPRKNIIFGKWVKHSRWWPDYNIRFFKKGHVSWNEVIHSVPMTVGEGLDLEPKENFAIVHHHYESIEQYIERMNRYTTALANNLIEGGYNFGWPDLIRKPANEFLSRYFQGEGFKDGLHGLALAGLQAISEFVVYLKVWQIEKFKSAHVDLEEAVAEMKVVESDFHYWQSDTLLKEAGGLKYRIKRKFKL